MNAQIPALIYRPRFVPERLGFRLNQNFRQAVRKVMGSGSALLR